MSQKQVNQSLSYPQQHQQQNQKNQDKLQQSNKQPQITDTFIYQEPTKQPYQYKIFINKCNGYIGSQLVQQFRNDHQIQVNPNIIIGTLQQQLQQNVNNNNEQELKENINAFQILKQKELSEFGINSIINPKKNLKLYNSVISQADIILFTLDHSSSQDFQYLLKFLKYGLNTNNSKQEKDIKRKKILVCISSLITWNGRKTQFINHGKLNSSYLTKRNSSESYLLSLQNQCLALEKQGNSKIFQIESHVVSSGVVYGLGQSQNQLFSYFKKALEQIQKLKIFGIGSNYLPMIHLQDLAKIVYHNVVFRNSQQNNKKRYHFAVDNSKITQKQLIQCISSNIGNGQYEVVPIQQGFLNPLFDIMTLNIQIDQECKQKLQEWTCKSGILQNIGTVISQFNTYRGLKPNKIMIIGQPGCGKTKFSENLQKIYGLPIIDIKNVIQQIKKEEGQYPDRIRQMLQQLKATKVQQQRKAFEQAKKKKKGKGVQQFDPEKVIPRLPDQQLVKIYKRRLSKSDCQNKGYILDGWPKSYSQAEKLFQLKLQSIQGQQGSYQIDEKLLPNSIFLFGSSQEQVKQRLKKIAPQELASTHWTQQHTTRRFQAYNQLNSDKPLKSFFEKSNSKVQIKNIQFNYQNMTPYTAFIQRNGPLGFKKRQQGKSQDQRQNKQKQQKDQQRDLKQGQQYKQENQNQDSQQKSQKRGQNYQQEQQQFDIQKLKQNQKKILNQKSRPIRQYLIDNVIPQITQGLLEICRSTPQDPVLFLIKFLEGKQDLRKNPLKK